MSTAEPRSVSASAGARVTGLLAVIYGLGVAFLPDRAGALYQVWLFAGAAIVGVLFIVCLVIPFVRRVMSSSGPGH